MDQKRGEGGTLNVRYEDSGSRGWIELRLVYRTPWSLNKGSLELLHILQLGQGLACIEYFVVPGRHL